MPAPVPTMRPLIAVLPLLVLGACAQQAEGTRGYGAIVTEEGIKANNDRNHREDVCLHLTHDITAALAPNWSARVRIDELPTWVSAADANEGDWRWPRATVHITLVGAGSLAHTVEEIRQGVVDHLAPQVRSPATNLTVLVTTEAATPVAATPVAASGPRTYTVQAGDTLADISTLFYGAPEHWRLITSANPGLNPAALTAGAVITIPPRP